MAFPTTALPAPCVAPELEDIEAAVDALSKLDPAEMSGVELSESIVALHRLGDRLEGLGARFTSAWDANNVWADDGARSGASWLSHRLAIPRQVGRALISFARRLRHTPQTEAALVDGRVGVAQARRLCRAVTHNDEAFHRDEEMLLDHAQSLGYADFDRAVTYWEQLADPDRVEAQASARDDARRLHLSRTFEGTWVLDGVSDTLGGSVVAEALRRLDDELFERAGPSGLRRVRTEQASMPRRGTHTGHAAAWRAVAPNCVRAPSRISLRSVRTQGPWPGGCASCPTAPWSPRANSCPGSPPRTWSASCSTGRPA